MAFSTYLPAELSTKLTTIHIVGETARPHHGKHVRKWLPVHPRCGVHCTPVSCSWCNQVAQRFSLLQRKRLCMTAFASKPDL
jgi:hypothetical protein